MNATVFLFKALADETRLRILSLLLTAGEVCVCDIMAALNQPQSTISRHLAYLRKAGWVSDRRCGLWIYYSIDRSRAVSHHGLVEFLRNHLTRLPIAEADRRQFENLSKDSTWFFSFPPAGMPAVVEQLSMTEKLPPSPAITKRNKEREA